MDEFKDNIYRKNIKDIKSSFIKKIIFSFLNEKQKLNNLEFFYKKCLILIPLHYNEILRIFIYSIPR